ncbi:hypothetical protein O3M35_000897 [Rhynocoris fuscipes]|uniref:Uncharacterized protein n=1 Tax=Rhynocoris fuscipes TaxID=488301 RepID=A0AAW1DQG4_9HEMI
MQVAKMFPVRKGSHPGKLLDHSPATSISLSKLADESQLGSLSKLLTPTHNNNVNDCNYETWTAEVPVGTVSNNNCNQQDENTLHYKSFMPLKKRFRQDFANEIFKDSLQESTKVSVVHANNNESVASDKFSRTSLEDIDITPKNHYQDKIVNTNNKKNAEERKESRTTKFRACKGVRYKIFMNTNSRRTRHNKTNSWDLRQKSVAADKLNFDRNLEIQQRINDLSNLDMDDYDKSQLRSKRPKKIAKTKRKKRQLSPTKSNTSIDNTGGNKRETGDFLDLDMELEKTIKLEKINEIKEEIDLNVKLNGNNNILNNKENGIFDDDINQSNLIDEIKSDNQLSAFNSDINVDNFENKTGTTVVGSRKRKLRKQNIMRLQPGSTFKDTRVVEDSVVCDLGTLADVAVCSEQKSGQD